MNESEAVTELCGLVFYWHDYEDIPRSQQTKAREVGKRLFIMGGTALMREAYYAAKSRNRTASVLNYYWDGIGEWRS